MEPVITGTKQSSQPSPQAKTELHVGPVVSFLPFRPFGIDAIPLSQRQAGPELPFFLE